MLFNFFKRLIIAIEIKHDTISEVTDRIGIEVKWSQ